MDKDLSNIKLVVLDLDGTLLSESGNIGMKSLEFVKKLRAKGVKFTFASGRLHSAFVEYAAELMLDNYLISLDGALIKSFPKGEILFSSYLSKSHVQKCLAMSNKNLVRMALCCEDSIKFTEDNSVIQDIIDKFGAKYDEVISYTPYLHSSLEALFISEKKDKLNEIRDRLSFPYAFGLRCGISKSNSNENIYIMEVRNSGNTKATGLKRLGKKLGIKIQETAVVGDWYNDLDLFKTEAIKVSLANAVSEIKFHSDIIMEKSNNEDGVGDFLEKIYSQKK